MIDFENVLYKMIGSRVRNYRVKNLKITQKDFAARVQHNHFFLDTSKLSHIEKGRIKKNTSSFLTINQIQDLSSMMGCDPVELIFGTEAEKDIIVKLLLLAILMNGSTHYENGKLLNPFIDINESENSVVEFFRLASLNITDQNLKRECFDVYIEHIARQKPSKNNDAIINNCKQWYKANFCFFSNPSNFEKFNLLNSSYNKKIEIQSNILMNLLLSDVDFCLDFMNRVYYTSKNNSEIEKILTNLIEHEGQFGGFIIDWMEVSYPLFVKAFNEMWEKNRDVFMDFFEENLFDPNNIRNNGLKDIKNSSIEALLTDISFIKILYKLLNNERFKTDTMIGQKIFQNFIDLYLIEKNEDSDHILSEANYSLYKFNYDIHQIIKAYSTLNNLSDQNQISINLYVKSYLKIHTNK